MPVLGKRPNVFAAPQAKAYRPTMRDQAGSLLSNVLGNTYQGNRIARNVFGSSGLGGGQGNLLGGLGLLDLTPIGAAFALEEAGRQIGGGQPVTGAANVALGMVPIPAVAKGGKAAVKGVARRVAGKAAKAAPAPKPGFTAYHGSPHTFDQFDTAKIGTGEGAQAYGHGLYFAEKEGVARAYRDTLSKGTIRGGDGGAIRNTYIGDTDAFVDEINRLAKTHGIPPVSATARRYTYSDHGGLVDEAFQEVGGDFDQMAAWLRQKADDEADNLVRTYVPEAEAREVRKAYLDAASLVEKAKGAENPGSMYQVRINADPNDFLDYDAPLSGQSEKVRASLLGLGVPDRSHVTGELAYADLAGQAVMKGAQFGQPAQAIATDRLREAGIPGIRYLDQGSRGAGEGSRNFVVFDPRIIDIMKRYGVAAPVAAAILAGTMQPPKGKEPGA